MSSEIVAMRSGGISLYRLMAPFIVSSLIVCIGSVYFDGWILPRANVKVEEIIRDYIHEDILANQQMDLYLQDSPARIVSLTDYSWSQKRGMKVSIQEFDPKDITHMISRTDAAIMSWDTARNEWHLANATVRTFRTDTTAEITRELSNAESFMHFSFFPDELKDRLLKMEEMTIPELAGAHRAQTPLRAKRSAGRSGLPKQIRACVYIANCRSVRSSILFEEKARRIEL